MTDTRRYAPYAVAVSAVVAADLLYASSHGTPGGVQFYVCTFFAALLYAACWAWAPIAHSWTVGSPVKTSLLRGAALGVGLLALFLMGAVVMRFIPFLAGPIGTLLENEKQGIPALTALTTFVNGVGEELYFRRFVPAFLQLKGRRAWVLPLVLYVLVTAAMGVPLLAVAAIMIGGAAHYEVARERGGVVAAITLHTIWSQGMLWLLPAVMGL